MYPAEHRNKHQDEMLGVLMTGARAGQRWPGLADSANLITGALRIRLRLPHGEGTRQGWADALAVAGVLMPTLVLAFFGAQDLHTLAVMPWGMALTAYAESAAPWIILAVLVLLGLLGLRRIAGLAATGMLIWLTVVLAGAPNWVYAEPQSMIVLVIFGLESMALLASPGPRRGMKLMTWNHYAVAIAVPAAIGSLLWWLGPAHPAVLGAVALAVMAIVLAGMTLASPLGKRLAILLSIPAYYVVTGFLVLPRLETGGGGTMEVWDGPLRITLTVIPFAVLAYVALATALRRARHASPGGRAA
jgi:hypothetical protein